MVSCSDENEPAREPSLNVSVNTQDLVVNQSMELRFTGVADQIVVFTGDKSHDYALKDSSNTGFAVNKGLFTYSYSSPGTFHVVCIGTTYDTYMGDGLRTVMKEFDVTVKDTINSIDEIYTTATPNVYYATLVNASDWLLCLPTKQLYNNREITVSAKRRRLSIDIKSDSASVAIDGTTYQSKTYYDLTEPHNIVVTANSGDVRNYMLYTLIYPEFNSVTFDGVAATLSRNAFYQDLQTYTCTVPSTTDLENVPIVYTVDSDVKLYADDTEVASGSNIDLTQTGVTYTLRRYLSGRSDIYAVSRLIFSVSK